MEKKEVVILSAAVALIIILILLSSSKAPVEQKPPNLSVNIDPFLQKGCKINENQLNCSKIGLESEYNCKYLTKPSKYLGGLKPKVSFVECLTVVENFSSDSGILHKGCMLPLFNKYIVMKDGETTVIKSKEEFIDFFAPVETKNEALGFATALTDSGPKYNLSLPESYEIFSENLRPTFVKEREEGFKVHLYDYQFCGCGPHPYYSVNYSVSKGGEVKKLSSKKAFKNPSMDGMCVD